MPGSRPMDNLSDDALRLVMELASRGVQVLADPDRRTLYCGNWQELSGELRGRIKEYAAELMDWLGR